MWGWGWGWGVTSFTLAEPHPYLLMQLQTVEPIQTESKVRKKMIRMLESKNEKVNKVGIHTEGNHIATIMIKMISIRIAASERTASTQL